LYVFKGELPPLRLTFSDLEQFLVDLKHIQNRALGDSNGRVRCTYVLTGPKMAISGPSTEQVFGDPRLPAFANEFRLSCYQHPLTTSTPSISMTLSTSPRWEVSGTDRILLELVQGHIEGFGHDHSTYLGGTTAQFLFLFVCYWITSLIPKFIANRIHTREIRIKNDLWISLTAYALGTLAMVSLMVSGIPERVFPSVEIYRGTASVLERYSPEISFWGLILSLGLTILLSRRPVAIVAPKVEAPPSPQKVQNLSPKA